MVEIRMNIVLGIFAFLCHPFDFDFELMLKPKQPSTEHNTIPN